MLSSSEISLFSKSAMYPIVPNTAKPATIEYTELEMAMMTLLENTGDGQREEHLRHRLGPHNRLTLQYRKVPLANVRLDAITTTVKADRDVCNATSPLYTERETQVNEHPRHRKCAYVRPHKTGGCIVLADRFQPGDDGSKPPERTLLGLSPPSAIRALTAVHKHAQRPRKKHAVIGGDDERGENGRQSDATKARMHLSKRAGITGLIVLPHGHLENQDGDSNDEERKQIRKEESASAMRVGEVGEAPNVSEADCGTDGRHDEGGARGPCCALAGHGGVGKERRRCEA
ncbi:hypothetical protein FGB62_331g09 [Gracilaria domingensis]|nr:hypothetical protein FGB62_331g09 [Gracilaria domingensis]